MEFMKSYLTVFGASFLLLFSCNDMEQREFVTTDFGIFAENQMLCAGGSTKLRVLNIGTLKEVPINEILFKPLPSENGIISTSGIYTAPTSVTTSNTTVTIEAKFKKGGPEVILGYILNQPKDNSTDTWVQSATSSLAQRWRYSTFENGDFLFTNPVQGFGSPANPSYELVKVSREGKLLEMKTMGQGFSIFTKVKGQKVYSLGLKAQNPFNTLSMDVMDENLNSILHFLLPQGVIQLFDVDPAGNIYAEVWEEFDRVLVKINERGEVIWKSNLGYEFLSLMVDTKGNTYGLVRIPELPDKEALVKVSSEGLEEWFLPTGREATQSVLFLAKDGNVGLGSELRVGTSNSWVQNLFNANGEWIQKNQLVIDSFQQGDYSPTVQLFTLANIHEVFVSKSGEVFFVGTGSYSTTVSYLFIASSSSGQFWTWWKMNPLNSAYLRPMAISEDEDGLFFLADAGSQFLSFRIRKNLTFNTCLNPPFWRTN